MHDLTQTIIDETTLITTSVDSYEFTCPMCDKQARYAYSFNNKIEVFCNGQDFGTKIKLTNIILEESSAFFIKENFTDDVPVIDVPQELIDLSLVELTDVGYILTETGKQVTEELNG